MKNNLEDEIRDWLENVNLPKHDNYNDGDIRETARHFAEWAEERGEDAKNSALRNLAWKVHFMISQGKSMHEIDDYVTSICDF